MRYLCLIIVVALLSGCVTAPPSNPNNICDIFYEKSGWYKAAHKSYKRWGAPIPVQMSIIYQESSFVADARPPRKRLLGFIPWTHISTAYGYAQALNQTWDWYKDTAGRRFASRTNFADAVDFVGWYINLSYKQIGISKYDAYSHYLAYHEGQGGFKRGTYRSKSWLMGAASKVQARKNRYTSQLAVCEARLQKGPWWKFW